MIRVTQGHERGVGLEIFLKGFLCLPKQQQERFLLYCNPKSLKRTLDTLNLPYSIRGNRLEVLNSTLSFVDVAEHSSLPETSQALYKALDEMTASDILLTLPSSKDQIQGKNGEAYKGHTDLLRDYFSSLSSSVIMSFISPRLNVALMSDHISLAQVEGYLNGIGLRNFIGECLKELKGIACIKNIYVAGVNPHCGEDGLISKFDAKLQEQLRMAQKEFKDVLIHGLLPGDTVLFNPISKENLYIFTFHDQGLAPFKLMNGLTGINLTLGLPFKRVSVDHGTAFNLFGKNQASYQGMSYLLDEILSWE